MALTETAAKQATRCFHCGVDCPDRSIVDDGHYFCCHGCLAVYQLLGDSNLSEYYQQESSPGQKPVMRRAEQRFAYLDDPQIIRQLLDFTDGQVSRLRLELPQIHCTACIYLLENLHRIESGIQMSTVDFPRRELTVIFENEELSLRSLIELLSRIGYEPAIQLSSTDRQPVADHNRTLYAKISVAGFAFGNIMLFSFPDYLAIDGLSDDLLTALFRYASILLAVPVLLYSCSDYFRSALVGLRQKRLNIDVLISLGMAVLFSRSVYDILTMAGSGYLDSFAGLTFFLLLGRLFQQKTYHRLSFDRNYRSYFPISTVRITDDGERAVPIMNIEIGDEILVRHQEIIPVDSILSDGESHIDYSFVTGESELQAVPAGSIVYAGGRQVGGAIKLKVIKRVSQSYLVKLWNQDVFGETNKSEVADLADRVSRVFTPVVLLLALAAAAFWMDAGAAVSLNVLTSVLIVACPCALALASPFALGTAQRIMGRRHLFLKDSSTVEKMARVDQIVFDKTGTLTVAESGTVVFDGSRISDAEAGLVASLADQSTHPTSILISQALSNMERFVVTDFVETPGYGISGRVKSRTIRIGSWDWITAELGSASLPAPADASQGAWFSIDAEIQGRFATRSQYRDGIPELAKRLRRRYNLSMLSGDSDRERTALASMMGRAADLLFKQTPFDKLSVIRKLRDVGLTVLMVGDGLNDGGALKAANIGLAVTDSSAAFSPASDGILDGGSVKFLDNHLNFARRTVAVVWVSFALSLAYNVVGLAFAMSGQLTPVLSAILMPASSITIVLFATLMTKWQAHATGVS